MFCRGCFLFIDPVLQLTRYQGSNPCPRDRIRLISLLIERLRVLTFMETLDIKSVCVGPCVDLSKKCLETLTSTSVVDHYTNISPGSYTTLREVTGVYGW